MSKEQKFVKYLRLKNYLYKCKIPIIPKILDIIGRLAFSCEIPSSVEMGDGIVFAHYGLGVVIHGRTTIGKNVKIYQNVTIGSRNNIGPPKIGDNVLIGTGAAILGNINIGNNVKIGANSVVLDDIPDDSVVVGIPGKIIKLKTSDIKDK